jgi:hypothetical protein
MQNILSAQKYLKESRRVAGLIGAKLGGKIFQNRSDLTSRHDQLVDDVVERKN